MRSRQSAAAALSGRALNAHAKGGYRIVGVLSPQKPLCFGIVHDVPLLKTVQFAGSLYQQEHQNGNRRKPQAQRNRTGIQRA